MMYIRSASSPSTVLWAFHTIQPSSSYCIYIRSVHCRSADGDRKSRIIITHVRRRHTGVRLASTVTTFTTARRQRQLPTSPLLIDGCSVSPVKSVRDLGIYIDSDLTMQTHVKRTDIRLRLSSFVALTIVFERITCTFTCPAWLQRPRKRLYLSTHLYNER